MPTPHTVSAAWHMACPQCGEDDQIDIGATVYVRLGSDETDITAAANGDYEWDGDASALCNACGYAGTVTSFTTDGRGQSCASTLTAIATASSHARRA